MNKQEKIQQAIIDQLKHESQAELARKIGKGKVSESTLIQIKTGNWTHISDKMWNKLAAYFRIPTTEVEAWPVFVTPNYQAIVDLCADVQENHKMMAISGFTGAGKTTALSEYARKNGDVYYVLCDVTMTQKEFLAAIARSMGLALDTSINGYIQAITQKVAQVECPLLILDDAGKLFEKQGGKNFSLIQVIYDRTPGRLGILMAGTETLKLKMDEAVRKSKMGFGELFGRIQYWLPLRRPSRTSIIIIAQHHGITSSDALDYLCVAVKNYRQLYNYITNARRASTKLGADLITHDLLAGLHVGDQHFLAA